jgi:hypothetical protein
MSNKRFISFNNGIARFGIDRDAVWIIDLEKKRQGLRTNPATSIFEREFGVNWIDWYGELTGDFLLDDDDNYLWLEADTTTENGDFPTHEDAIDNGEAYVSINLKDLTFYHKGNGCYSPIV